MKKRIVAMLLLTAMMGITGCQQSSEAAPERTREVGVTYDLEDYDISTRDHMINMMDYLSSQNQGENILISGTSIDMALGMTMQGASGESLSALEDFFGDDADTVSEYSAALIGRYDDIRGVDVLISNAIYCDEDCRFMKEYASQLESMYGAEASELEFHDDPEGSAKVINQFCKDSTDGMIPEIVSPDLVEGSDTILVNAIYFNGKWKKGFDEDHVSDMTFNNVSGDTTTVQGMRTKISYIYENDNAIAFAYEYKDDSIVFIGILPDESICDADGNFDMADIDIDGLLDSRKRNDAMFEIPKFELEYGTSLDDALKNEGLECLYENMDLTNMAESPLGVSTVVHKVKVEIDEEGTKASAATAVSNKKNAIDDDYKMIILDRPFAFMIYDTETDTALFMGKVVDL